MIGYADLADGEPIPTEIFVVWEGLVGLPGPRLTEKRLRRRTRWHSRWSSPLDLYEETNGRAVAELWRLWQRDVNVALVTYLPDELKGDLATRVEAGSIPASRLVVTTPNEMARMLTQLGAAHLFHSLPEHTLRYGPRGIYVHPHHCELMSQVN